MKAMVFPNEIFETRYPLTISNEPLRIQAEKNVITIKIIKYIMVFDITKVPKDLLFLLTCLFPIKSNKPNVRPRTNPEIIELV